jgi:hypothetical protein
MDVDALFKALESEGVPDEQSPYYRGFVRGYLDRTLHRPCFPASTGPRHPSDQCIPCLGSDEQSGYLNGWIFASQNNN